MQDYMYEKMFEIENTHWWFQAKKDIITQLIRNRIIPKLGKSKIDIADIGCGVGLLLNSLTEFGQVTGIDKSKQALDFCKKSFNGELIQVDCTESISVDKKFDLIIATDFIEHIKDDKIAINNIYNLLKPNGYAIITVPAFQFLWSMHDVNNIHYRRYEKDNLIKLLKFVNLKIKYLSYYNFFLFIPAFGVRILKKIFDIDKESNMELSIPPSIVNKLMFKIFKSEYKFISRNKHFPFGLSLIAIINK